MVYPWLQITCKETANNLQYTCKISATNNLHSNLENISLQFYLRHFLRTHLCSNELVLILPLYSTSPLFIDTSTHLYMGFRPSMLCLLVGQSLALFSNRGISREMAGNNLKTICNAPANNLQPASKSGLSLCISIFVPPSRRIFVQRKMFCCVHATLYEALSVLPSVRPSVVNLLKPAKTV